ncbi:MAG: Putative NAD/FAD-dependent oxidoreductase [uncultured Sulfurovum sp.]|uniref:NAD/FAD-dependent oxidoreductase n=1 Tax=uncultured Sulfurovum sp. TaxID=269237 RepID=A0A6S6SMC2_9BACT|nr:MAG: Putative NAD/FAD-dependent oxidoreductase [uncultured Sulfurovum sp.]
MNVAIIGAGFAGSYLAHRLHKKNINVTLFEKSRGPGGRMATRRDNSFQINHGCMGFSPSKLGFKVFCEDLVNDGIINKKDNNHYYTNQMNSVLKHLSKDVHVQNKTHIKSIKYLNAEYILRDQNNKDYEGFNFIIMTIPPAQILALNSNFKSTNNAPLSKVTFDSVVTLALYGSEVKNLDKVRLSSLKNLAKLSIQNEESLVLHMNAAFSNEYNNLTKKVLEPLLIQEIQKVLPHFNIQKYGHFTHLWKYGFTKKPYGEPYIYDEEKNYAICADWLNGKNVEDAYTSVNTFLNDHTSKFI